MIIAHLSDLHLGRRFLWDPAGAERLNSFRQALGTLSSQSPAAILIAGDVFDSPQVDQAMIRETARTLNKTKNASGEEVPVVVIPGNHDPSDSNALWNTFRSSLNPGSLVRLVLAAELVKLCEGNLLIEAYPCETRYSPEAPWARRLEVADELQHAMRVVLAHGTLEGGPVPEGESDAYPFTAADLEKLAADYVALGHFHGVYPPWGGGEKMQRTFCYSGTHEPDQFGGDSGHAILATIAKGTPTTLARLKVGRREWRLVEIAGPMDLQKAEALLTEVEADPTRYVIRFKVGADTRVLPETATRLEAIEDSLRVLGAQVDRRGEFQSLVDVTALDLGDLPTGAIKEALLSLQEELAQAQDAHQRDIISAAIQLGWEAFKETR